MNHVGRQDLESILGTLGDVVFRTDHEGLFTYLNPAWTTLTGLPIPATLGRSFASLLRVADGEPAADGVFDLFGPRESVLRRRVSCATASGARCWAEVHACLLRADDGRVLGVAGTLRDVTELCLAEDELQRRRELTRAIALASNRLLADTELAAALDEALALAGEAARAERVWIHRCVEDPETGRWRSRHLYEWTQPGVRPGMSVPELQDLPYQDILPRWHDLLTAGRSIRSRVADLPDAERAFMQQFGVDAVLIVPVTIDRRLWGAVGVDYMDARRALCPEDEPILMLLAGGIAAAVTRSRTEAELARARDAAEAASRAKSAFLATLSHEIRTPLNGIIGMTDLLLDGPLNEDQRDALRTIRASGEGLVTILNDVLDFSKIEQHRLTLEREPVDLRETIAFVISILRQDADRRGLALSGRVSDTVPLRIMADRHRLRQVLLNLTGNALKFTHEGRVEVEAAYVGGTLAIAVRDTGIGIPEDRLALLFEPFTQLEAASTRRYGGTGIGLAISRRLTEKMGGRIEAASRLGEGSTFTILLPCEPLVCDAASPVTERVPVVPLPPGLRVLLAEDHPVNRKVSLRMLERLGVHAEVAVNGLEVAEKVRATHYDLVLMDVNMPEQDGLEATRVIRARPGPQPRIVAMTALALHGDRERCLAAGMDDYICKPVGLDDLRRALEVAAACHSGT